VEPLKDQTVVAPETAKFTTTLKGGEPRAEVKWMKTGKPLSVDGKKYIAVFEGDEASLTITQCELSDAAEYSFSATNKVGSVTSKATLGVHGKCWLSLSSSLSHAFIHMLRRKKRSLNAQVQAMLMYCFVLLSLKVC